MCSKEVTRSSETLSLRGEGHHTIASALRATMALRYTCVSPARLVQPEGVVVSTSPESQELSFLDSSPTMLALYPCSAW